MRDEGGAPLFQLRGLASCGDIPLEISVCRTNLPTPVLDSEAKFWSPIVEDRLQDCIADEGQPGFESAAHDLLLKFSNFWPSFWTTKRRRLSEIRSVS